MQIHRVSGSTSASILAEARGEPARARVWRAHVGDLKTALERHGWDGDWYRRAYFDDGTPLGSAANAECRIDSIAQSRAVISGAGESLHPVHLARFQITFRYHASRYEIVVQNPRGVSREVLSMEVDDVPLPPDSANVTLTDDGATHRIRVVLGES